MNNEALLKLTLEIVGGLGLFLLGMKNMSEGMQAVAGQSLRRMISAVTNNRFTATTVGVIVTCVVQSSSVTTVMVVGFVNSGLMKLPQAIGVIMGANIGTTVTGWILVLKIGKYGLPLLGAAAFVYLFAKSDRWRFWAMALMGVGMVFFGLEIMKDACSIIKEMPDFKAWFKAFNADTYAGVLQCALAGCVLTTLVQSSSATLGITISLASQGVISFETTAALVLGENIGTTITAFLASLGATTVARRAAYFHVIFNLVGVLWITIIFQWYIGQIQEFTPGDVDTVQTTTAISYESDQTTGTNVQADDVPIKLKEVTITVPQNEAVSEVTSDAKIANWDVSNEAGKQVLRVEFLQPVTGAVEVRVTTKRMEGDDTGPLTSLLVNDQFDVQVGRRSETYPNRSAAIAMTHTIFNIVNTLMFLPFVSVFVSLLNWLVPSKGFKEKPKLTDLDIRMLETPTIAIEQSRREIERMGIGCAKMLDWLADLRNQDEPDKILADRLKHREQILDSMQDEMADFVTHLLAGNVPHAVAAEARQQLRMTDEYESVSDYIADLDKFDRKLRRAGHRFTLEQRDVLGSLHGHVTEYLAAVNEAQAKGNPEVLTQTDPASQRVKGEIKQLRRKHLEDLSNGSIPPAVSVAWLATLNAYSRVRDHVHNIAEAVSGEK